MVLLWVKNHRGALLAAVRGSRCRCGLSIFGVRQPGQAVYTELVAYVAPVFGAMGGLDRVALRRWVFADAQHRQWLQDLMHPVIRAAMQQWARRVAPYVLMVVLYWSEVGRMPPTPS